MLMLRLRRRVGVRVGLRVGVRVAVRVTVRVRPICPITPLRSFACCSDVIEASWCCLVPLPCPCSIFGCWPPGVCEGGLSYATPWLLAPWSIGLRVRVRLRLRVRLRVGTMF